MDTKEIDNRFTHHKVEGEQITRMSDIQARCAELAHAINSLLPDGREKSTALTYLEICMFFADAGVSRPNVSPSH
jgi:hypothetical protein